MRVVITDHRFPDVEQERRAVEASGGKLVVAQTEDEYQLAELCKDADGVLTVRAHITQRVIAAMERCRIIVRYGIGVDTIDIPAATERGIMVANVPDYCIDEVSDHALAAPVAGADVRPGRLRENRIASRRQGSGTWHANTHPRSLFEREPLPRDGCGASLA